MIIAFACDHGGFPAKQAILDHLKGLGHEVLDFGTWSTDSCNYPEFVFPAAEAVASGKAEKGVFVCSSGEGVCIVANKVKGIRAGIGYNDTVSQLLVEHNHANVITFGVKYMELADIIRRIDIFLGSIPADGRHDVRVQMITDYEESHK